jgi:DNA-binding MarR family transcriptional regulator
MEGDRLGRGKGGAEFGEGELFLRDRERREDLVGGGDVVRHRVGAQRLDSPDRRVRAPPRGGRGEPPVLGGHVGQQVGERPRRTRRRAAEIVGADLGHHVHAGGHGEPMGRQKTISKHMHIIYTCLSNVNDGTFPGMTEPPTSRNDLAAMIVPLGRALVAAELPVLRAHGLTMWGYVVLDALGDQPAPTQAALAQSIGADKTRIIGVLDELQQQNLIERRPDATDRRARLVSITESGRRKRAAAKVEIQRNEDRLLARLPAADRQGLLNALRFLSTLSQEEIIGPA